jgi:hypothetical protein
MRLRSLVLSGKIPSTPLVSTFKPDGAEATPMNSGGIGPRKFEFRFKAQMRFTDEKD